MSLRESNKSSSAAASGGVNVNVLELQDTSSATTTVTVTATSAPIAATGHSHSSENQLSQDLALFLASPSLRAALADGSLDLKSYSETVQSELEELESQCVSVYRSKASEIAALRQHLDACRTVLLPSLHEMLLGFRADLGGLSGDIRQLQSQSRRLDTQLRNRRAAECALRHYLERVVVAPAVVEAILHGPVNTNTSTTATFVAAVQEVQQLYRDCSGSGNSNSNNDWSCGVPVRETVSAGQEMLRELETLRHVAVKRSREYLLQQMALLRRPQTNVRLIQVHGLLKYAVLYDFLEDYNYNNNHSTMSSSTTTTTTPATAADSNGGNNNNNKIAAEIFSVYTESMSGTIKQLFRTYSQQLLLLDATRHSCTRADVIAIDDAALRESVQLAMAATASNNNNSNSKQQNSKQQQHQNKRVDPFTLGQRGTDCLPGTCTPIAAHVAVLQKEQYSYERLFGSLLGHLLDAVTNEHVFCRQFFKRDAFPQLFAGTLSLLTEQLENYLFTCYDALCLLLMIKVTHGIRRMARQRKIHSLDAFLDQITHLLWPRLKTVMDGHLRSILQADAASLGIAITSTTAADSMQQHAHAHYVSRRFGEFCCSILLILHDTTNHDTNNNSSSSTSSMKQSSPRRKSNVETLGLSPATKYASPQISSSSKKAVAKGEESQSAGGKLLQDLSAMTDSFVQLLERMAEEHSTQKKRTVFLINNLDQIVCIFHERRVTGKECSKLLELLMKYREDFVEEELLAGFSKMIAFVQQTEAHMASVLANKSGGAPTSSDSYDVNPVVVESLVLEFASNWKSNIDQINRNVLSYFSNFRNGMEILKHCLTQLLLYYTRFQDIIRKVWKKPPSFSKDLVSTTIILAEIKKYALAI